MRLKIEDYEPTVFTQKCLVAFLFVFKAIKWWLVDSY